MSKVLHENVFNIEKTDYEKVDLILGQQKMGLFDTVNKQYPEIWKNYKAQKSQDWSEDEFDYSQSIQDFKKCDRSQYDMMIKTLAWQWEADSVFARAIAPVLAPFITSSELWAAWQKISEIEVLHAATYSEIVRNSFDDPTDILNEILKVQEAHERMSLVGNAFNEGFIASHEYALGLIPNNQELYNKVMMTILALYLGERVQFMASFAVTFALCETGLFQPIGKAIQKICADEFEIHAQLDKIVLQHELKTERGLTFFKEKEKEIKAMIDQVVETEFEWVEYLFSEDRSLVGVTEETLKRWVLYCAKDVYRTMGVESKEKLPQSNPLKYMENWINISKLQPSPQEEQIAQYRLNIMKRDDENLEFDDDF